MLQPAGRQIVYANVVSQLNLAEASHDTGRLLSALGRPQGARPYVTGQAAIQHDLGPIFNQDLRRGEFEIAIPAALIVLLLVLGLSGIVSLPLLFAVTPRTLFGLCVSLHADDDGDGVTTPSS
jgi:uncharacterized membrane protein YdfJ with MMPL/SSD domain